jgi:hypothetical protein
MSLTVYNNSHDSIPFASYVSHSTLTLPNVAHMAILRRHAWRGLSDWAGRGRERVGLVACEREQAARWAGRGERSGSAREGRAAGRGHQGRHAVGRG